MPSPTCIIAGKLVPGGTAGKTLLYHMVIAQTGNKEVSAINSRVRQFCLL